MKKPVLVLLAIAFSAAGPAGRAERVFPPEVVETDSGTPFDSGPSDHASACFEIGVLVGLVEQGAWEGAEPGSLVPHLVQIRERAAKAGGDQSPLKDLEALIEAMESATESRDLHGRIVEFRKTLAARIARQFSAAEPIPIVEPFDCDQGSWEGVWETTWGDMTLVFDDEGQFHGTYGPSQHGLSGSFDPDNAKVLRGRWSHFGSTSTGGIRFEMRAPGRFEGGWSYEVPVVGAGSGWSGTRRKTHHSEILIVPIGEATVAADPLETGRRTWSQPFLIKKGFSVHGNNVDFPLIRIHTLASGTGEWEPGGRGYFHAGAGFHEIPSGGAFTIDLSFPEELARRKIAVEFAREATRDDEEESLITLRARPLLLVPPTRRPIEEFFPPEGEAPPDGEGEAPPDEVDATEPDGEEAAPPDGEEPGPP